MITDIRAVGGPITGAFVQITSDERGKELINRKEAIMRIQAVSHHGTASRDCDMIEALFIAADEARQLEKGVGYSKALKDQIFAELKRGRDAARAVNKLIAVPDQAPSGGNRYRYLQTSAPAASQPAPAPTPVLEASDTPPASAPQTPDPVPPPTP